MPRKLRVGIIFGGRSGEHEVSLRSAASVLAAIDKKKYDVVPIGIAKSGHWLLADEAQHMLAGGTTVTATHIAKGRAAHPSSLVPTAHPAGLLHVPASAANEQAEALGVDVLFPVLHGTFGEDGTIQGLFELAGKAYVGSGVLGSAAGMDKDVMKRLFMAAGLPIVEHITLLRGAWQKSPRKAIAEIEANLRYPLFVKPANLGSSVGISKVHDRSELAPAIVLAASYDRKIIIEQGVGGKAAKNKPAERARELEVAVLGNEDPKASVVGEIVPAKEFYDYEAKYESDGSIPIIPARLSKAQAKDVREMAIAAFHACDCSGLARVDFLLEPESRTGKPGRLYLNEINTMPGFTSISMYPKLWQASGLKYSDLIDRLIELALERRAERDDTQYSR
ncbi:MAG TPA: D-alanine--D-alanine ligase family protein [Acidobacteriaceae bacterium]|jgi:D-alanine-D-alanine ligase